MTACWRAGACAVAVVLVAQCAGVRRWEFDQTGEREGWSVPARSKGVVMGGALWISLAPGVADPRDLARTKYQIYGDPAFGHREPGVDLESPRGLNLSAALVTKVRLRVLNLSPVTDAFLRWRTSEKPERYGGSVRFTMKPDLKQWQEVVCHVDGRWSGTIDQIAVRFPITRIRGDLWIDWIEIGDGPPRAAPRRPDVASVRVVPKIRIPGISQAHFDDAFRVLDECLIVNVPVQGFTYPVMGPGGAYGENWWQLDSSLNLAGAKWANQQFADDVMRGFQAVQSENPDGRIDLYGGSAVRGQPADASSLPRYFEAAYDVARRTGDNALRETIYESMKRYLEWWLSPVKRDPATGLISGIFEETFGDADTVDLAPQSVAQVNLNVAVAEGCHHTASLAFSLGKTEEEAHYRRAFEALARSINTYLWDEEKGAYYNYDLRQRRRRPRLIASTFDPLRLGIAPRARAGRLLTRLLDPAQFNWGRLPVTSISMLEPGYLEATGPYDGRAWFGDIWTLINLMIVAGLEDAGRDDVAAELTWATVKAFNANYAEYLVPSSGTGQGVKRYGWSASQYIQAIVEHLFGVDYDRLERRLRITPRLPKALFDQELALDGLLLPTGGDTRLSVKVKQHSAEAAEIEVRISGPLPEGALEVALPGRPGVKGPVRRYVSARFP
jgi:hypothetical protein